MHLLPILDIWSVGLTLGFSAVLGGLMFLST